MGTFHRTNITSEGFIRGAARILVAPITQAFPTQINDIISVVSGSAQYDKKSGWEELGATKTGIQIARNNTEETFDVDQISSDISSQPTGWEMSVATALAEVTLERINLVWEAGTLTTGNVIGSAGTATQSQKTLTLGTPEQYTQRRLAVVFKRPATRSSDGATTTEGKLRAYVFRKVQRTPQESAFTHQRTGEQATLPIRWRCLADDNSDDINDRFGVIFDQV